MGGGERAPSLSVCSIIKCLTQMFATHGFPEKIVSDNAAQFTGAEFKEFLALNAILHRRITPYWPQANGEVERQNRTLCNAVRAAHSEGKDWREAMHTFLLAYRSTPHSVTGRSPAELLFNRQLRTRLPEVSSGVSSTVGDAAVRQRDFVGKEKGRRAADKTQAAVDKQDTNRRSCTAQTT